MMRMRRPQDDPRAGDIDTLHLVTSVVTGTLKMMIMIIWSGVSGVWS